MHSTAATSAMAMPVREATFATTDLISQLENLLRNGEDVAIRFSTPQRKANYKDKARCKLKDLKRVAIVECGWKSTKQVKKYLAVLGIHLDLRLSSAWLALTQELKPYIDAAKAIVDALSKPDIKSGNCQFKVGDKVVWLNAPAYIQAWWQWMTVEKIVGDRAVLDMWSGEPVPITELELWQPYSAIAA